MQGYNDVDAAELHLTIGRAPGRAVALDDVTRDRADRVDAAVVVKVTGGGKVGRVNLREVNVVT